MFFFEKPIHIKVHFSIKLEVIEVPFLPIFSGFYWLMANQTAATSDPYEHWKIDKKELQNRSQG